MRAVKRHEDMSQLGFLKVLVQDDGDVMGCGRLHCSALETVF